MDKVNLLIFDECHHATNDEPYKKIMDDFYRSVRSSRPRVLGLTASITGKKSIQINLKKLLNNSK